MMTFSFSVSILLIFLITWDATKVSNAFHCTTNNTIFNKTILTKSGPVFGTDILYKGRWVKQYLGIPFAKPPVGELRFLKPQPVEPWTEILVADKMPLACIQYMSKSEPINPWYDAADGKSENCLYLNIWVPTDKCESIGNKTLATIFWIYGGGFTVGSIRKEIYNGSVLAAEGDVIVVTVNYRMGAFGFFTSGTKDAPGNVGMYDMLEALKWVSSNIFAFGGNPSKITIAGDSSGAVAAGLLCISPLAKGLFRGSILQSGSPAYLEAEDNKANRKLSHQLAEKLGCASHNPDVEMNSTVDVQCLRDKDAMEIAKALYSFHPTSARTFLPSYGDEILPLNARQALIDGKFNHVPILVGNNENEASFQITTTYPKEFGFAGGFYSYFNKSQAEFMLRDIFKNFSGTEAVIEHYLGDVEEHDYQKIHKQILTASGDYSILCPTVYFAESYATAGNNVYFYYFVHRPEDSMWAEWLNVYHSEEVQYVFGYPLRKPKEYQHKEILLSRKMIHIWAKFAKEGSLDWERYTRQKPNYTELHTNLWTTHGLGPHTDGCNFFRKYFGFDPLWIWMPKKDT